MSPPWTIHSDQLVWKRGACPSPQHARVPPLFSPSPEVLSDWDFHENLEVICGVHSTWITLHVLWYLRPSLTSDGFIWCLFVQCSSIFFFYRLWALCYHQYDQTSVGKGSESVRVAGGHELLYRVGGEVQVKGKESEMKEGTDVKCFSIFILFCFSTFSGGGGRACLLPTGFKSTKYVPRANDGQGPIYLMDSLEI